MRAELVAAVKAAGVLTRAEALRIAPLHVVKDAVTDGVLCRLFPGVYVLPGSADVPGVRRAAALAYCGVDATLSHVDALDVWGLPTVVTPNRVHVTVAANRAELRAIGVILHRSRRLGGATPGGSRSPVRIRAGLPVVTLEQAVVESWPLLPPIERRSPAIVAVRQRMTTAPRLLATLQQQPRTGGAAEMRDLFGLLDMGLHSQLEIWGHERVLADRRLPPTRAQVPVDLPNGRRLYLDRLIEEVLVDVEFDGAAWHGRPGQRERDLRRDAALASLGYLPVRVTHERLTYDAVGVVEELLAIIAVRRRQLGSRPA